MSSSNVLLDLKIAVVNLPDFIKITADGVKIPVKVQPRSFANRIMVPTATVLHRSSRQP